MPSLHAFLVGIDEYADRDNNLRGCINDLEAFQIHLRAYYEDQYDLRFHVLKNQEATRQNIIEGFQHFNDAQNGDYCLFYFSGHGSQWKVPSVFSHLEADGHVESLVCHDSRQNGVQDLIDKELRHLVWEVTQGKDLHFLLFTDCCHSKGVFRSYQKEVGDRIRFRMISPKEEPLDVHKLYKYDEYEVTGEGKRVPRIGEFIHLAACRSKQKAAEVYADGDYRGIFTYSVLDALKACENHISYRELINKVNIRIRNNVDDQSAQFDASEQNMEHSRFLSNTTTRVGSFTGLFVRYERKEGWKVNLGAVHGLKQGNGKEEKNRLLLTDRKEQVEIGEIGPSFSTVLGMDHLTKSQHYQAELIQRAEPLIKVAVSLSSNREAVALLKTELEESKAGRFELVDDSRMARFLIWAEDKSYYLTSASDDRPLFKRVVGTDRPTVVDFINKAEKVMNWMKLMEWENEKGGSISDQELELSLWRITDPGNEADNAPKEWVDWQQTVALRYQRDRIGQVHEPAFQFKVKNTGGRKLWVSLLFLADDFSISNDLIHKEVLEPGDEAWALDRDKEGLTFKTNILAVEEAYQDWNINATDQYLKLIISTEEFDTSDFNQKGLQLERLTMPLRGRRKRRDRPASDWTVKEVHFRVIKDI